MSSVLIIDAVETAVLEIEGFIGQGPVGPPGQSGSPRVVTVPYAALITIDFSVADVVRLVLTGDCTITLSGANNQQKCTLILIQDGTGGHATTFGAEIRTGTELLIISPSTAAGKESKLGFTYDGPSHKYDLVAQLTGF